MYIYNVTIHIEKEVNEAWLDWMRATHIPDMLDTGKFVHARLCRVVEEEDDGGYTYAVQFLTTGHEVLEKYYLEDADRLRKATSDKFPGKIVAFRTELEVIEEQSLLT
jgi:hypothetical protein